MVKRTIAYFTRHRIAAFFVIFALAFAIRFTLLVHYRADITTVGEAPRIARALVTKGEFADPYAVPTGPTAHTTPFFPFVLAVVYKTFGFGFAGQFVRCLIIISGYSALYALYPTFAAAFGFPFEVGLLTGFVSALLPVKRSFEVFRAWEEPWVAMSLGLILILTFRRYRSGERDLKGAVLLGICWGVALYIGFAIASVLAGLLFVDVITHRSARVLRDAAVVVIAAFAVMSPWLIRNHNQLHGWTLMRDNLGLELRFSNRDYAHAAAERNAQDPHSEGLHPSFSVSEAERVRDMGELNYNKHEIALTEEWIKRDPKDFALLTAEHFAYFWLGPMEHKYELLFTSLYTLVGLAGLGVIRRSVGELQFRLWCTVFFFYPLLYYCVQYIPRYRVSIDWMIWLSAGLVVWSVLEKQMTVEKEQAYARAIS